MNDVPSPKTTHRRRIVFSFSDKAAHEVAVAGDFNQWNRKSHRMKPNGQGRWQKIMMLPPGQYEYKFWVDGRWRTDPDNPIQSPNCFGTYNNVLQVLNKGS
jgi:5'-AMP-activated protein kinase regulatory beta subunit